MDAAASELLAVRLDLTPAEALAQRAAVLGAVHSLTVYDAAFAALAEQLDAELITADTRLAASGACKVRLL